ncbi:DUF4326 domain-containing protein [Kribbella capetownensis]|uniref:DUF4326 domain-containing protein n=1 Tax=Kribbella capetownensis TaxID=1572659 RepID=A0A4R0IN81_9ACTN|nr:DUF4326 domain-containing protein [Kribbella capetownensis]TCC33880.1 DUF4326 domain-containing protein [Kribbella capetownensis]
MTATASDHRVRLSRVAGARLPADAASVAWPTKWHNPHKPARRSPEANAAAVAAYRGHLREHPELVAAARVELAGKRLACWCPLELPCHADVLAEVRDGLDP